MTLLASASALVLLLAGCGVTSGNGGAPSTNPTATATETIVRPCSGPDGSVTDVGPIALILSRATPAASATPVATGTVGFPPIEGSAHVGDIVQVQLSITNRWNLSSQTGSLTLLSPSAVLDTINSVCFWNFKATAVGDTTLNFVGGALCAPTQACPQYAILESFLVHVS